MPRTLESTTCSSAVDYDLHGIVGIRLLGATPQDQRAIDKQLGPIRKPLEREPDITIRFVANLEDGDTKNQQGYRLLGANEVAFVPTISAFSSIAFLFCFNFATISWSAFNCSI